MNTGKLVQPWDSSEDFKTTIAREFRDLVIGDGIAEGCSRSVWHHATDKTLVVKIDHKQDSFDNAKEYEIWQTVKDTEFAKWFAPITYLSGFGRVMFQKKTTWINGDMPEKVPAFFCDLKRQNWGMYKGHPVCHDYALNYLLEMGLTKRMKKAKW